MQFQTLPCRPRPNATKFSFFRQPFSLPRSAWEHVLDALHPKQSGTRSVRAAFPRRAWERDKLRILSSIGPNNHEVFVNAGRVEEWKCQMLLPFFHSPCLLISHGESSQFLPSLYLSPCCSQLIFRGHGRTAAQRHL